MTLRETLLVIIERYDHMFSTSPLDWTAHDFIAAGLLFSVCVVVSWFIVHEVRVFRSSRKRRRERGGRVASNE